jgi:solute carrier family 25 citrate transporter 1
VRAIYTGCSSLITVSCSHLKFHGSKTNLTSQGTAAKAGVRFLTFDAVKAQLADSNGKLTAGSNILAGMIAGAVESVTVVTPTERIKTAL